MTHHTSRITDYSVVCIIGLGYVGLPLVEAFAKSMKVIGFDTDSGKVNQLKSHESIVYSHQSYPQPQTQDYPLSTNLTFSDDPREISKADFIIICVPTPVTKSKEPDLSHIQHGTRITGQNMKRGSVVILESTVYPGVTEEMVKPVLEQESGLKCGEDFKVAYSPERINPGDKEHTIDRITPYIYKAKDIKTAEAAKVIENIQRDLDIALVNELSIIFNKIGLSTKHILEAAETKWNFRRYSPGLVGGHCIPVDPYYLVYKAKELDYHPQVILAGRAINDSMPKHVAEMTIKALNDVGKVIKGSKVLIMGLAYKENVPDTRETPVKGIIKELKEYGIEIYGYDPLLNDIEPEFGIKAYGSRPLTNDSRLSTNNVDCVILAVAHSAFRSLSLADLKEMQNDNPILIDVRGVFDAGQAKMFGFYYKTL